ncbi:MAG: CDP-diacylglycerol--glycerol-3-phosphate 3-phosphatidyltransferase [Acidobacteria bacterium]|nr:CDP-diacylglycerol--glycerol-3-phosphate 3-phosphatidyltransferase [Acidobacteriota bacterium]
MPDECAPTESAAVREPPLSTMNLPNLLTLFRIFTVPLLVVVILTKFEGKEILGIAIVIVASLTDWLDGYIARRRRQVTKLGIHLDPIADKLLVCSAFVALVQEGLVQAWMVVIIIGREIAVTGLRSIAASHGLQIPASPLGKVKLVTQIVAICLLLGQKYLGEFDVLALAALWLVVALALSSGAEYCIRFRRLFQQT